MKLITRPLGTLVAFCLTVLSVAGCGAISAGESPGSNAQQPSASQAMPSQSASNQIAVQPENTWPAKITIVQMPDDNNPDAGQMHDGFRKEMEEYVGIKVEELEASDYTVGIEAMKSKKLEVMLVSPMSYYNAKRMVGVDPVVTTGTEGVTPYITVFLTKSDRDDINTMDDLRDKTFAFVDPASSSGYMYPKAKLITELDLDAELLESPGYFFKTVAYSGKHDSSLIGVTMGDYDAAAVALSVIDSVVEAGLINKDDVKIIGETEVIPSACFVMRSDLPQDLKDKIKEFYLQYDDAAYFEAFYKNPELRFIEAKDSDYDVVDEMIKILKIEE